MIHDSSILLIRLGIHNKDELQKYRNYILRRIPTINQILSYLSCNGQYTLQISNHPIMVLSEQNYCDEAPNVYCFGIDFSCCDMLFNSRQSLNKRENPRIGKKFTGNRISKP